MQKKAKTAVVKKTKIDADDEGEALPQIAKDLTRNLHTANDFAKSINILWQKTAEGFIQIGQILRAARVQLGSKEWKKLTEGDMLPFDERKMQMFIRMARNPVFQKPSHVAQLPPSYTTIDVLGKLDQQHLLIAFKKKDIHPNMERRDAEELVEKTKPKEKNKKIEDKPSKPSKAPLTREADDAETIDDADDSDEDTSVRVTTSNRRQTEPPKSDIELALENFESAIDSMAFFADGLGKTMETEGVKRLPKDMQRKLKNLNEVLSTWVRKYVS